MSIAETWKDLSIWRKGIIGILTIMWLTFSGVTMTSLAGSWFALVLALCLLWLAFIAITYVVTRAYGKNY